MKFRMQKLLAFSVNQIKMYKIISDSFAKESVIVQIRILIVAQPLFNHATDVSDPKKLLKILQSRSTILSLYLLQT